MPEWSALLNGEITVDEASPLISRAAEALHIFLETQPRVAEEMPDILGKRLGGKITPDTWDALKTTLTNYLGMELANLVIWVLQDDPAERVAALEKYASAQVVVFMRRILGLYGPELEVAFEYWNRIPDEWSLFQRRILYDQIYQRYSLQVQIEKYNGEKIVIEGSPNSILDLTRHMIITLRRIDSPDAFRQRNKDEFINEVTQLVGILRPQGEQETATQPEPDKNGKAV